MKYLTVFPSKTVVFQIERIASGLQPTTVELTLPLNATEGPKLSFSSLIGDQVVCKDGSSCPKLSLIHAASFEGSQRRIRCDLQY